MLAVAGLKAAYGRIPILHGIDLNVAEGEFVGILGHNGMGKTTLLKTLIGLLRPTGGSIELNGKNITRMPAYKRNLNGMGYVPQGRDIFPNLTVLDNLRIAFAMHKVEEEKVLEEVLEVFPRLKPLLERSGRVLSGGEQQILALARCLCGSPSLLLLDEPTEGIQPSIIKDIQRIIGSLRDRGDMAIVLVEQYFEFARDLADSFVVMERSEVVLSGQRSDMVEADVRRYLTV